MMRSDTSDILKTLPLDFFDALYNSVVVTTARLTGDHPKILYVNAAFTRMTGYSAEEILGKTPRVLQGEETDRKVLDQLKEDLTQGRIFEGEAFNYRKNGSRYRVRWMVEPLHDARGETIGYISFQQDITAEYDLLQHRKLFQKAIDQTSMHVALFDTGGRYIYANKAYVERTGYTLEELMGTRPALLHSGVQDDAFYDKMWTELNHEHSFMALFTNKNAEGELYYEQQTISPIREQGTTLGYVVFGKSFDEELRERNRLLYETMTDPLTGLLNRKALTIEVEQAIEEYHNRNHPFSLIFADLNDFKLVNDRYGHDTGDMILRSMATVLTENVRQSDPIIRFGGDEFICLLRNVKRDRAQQIADKLKQRITDHPEHRKYGVGVSIGVSEYRGESADELIRRADREMYRSKGELKSDDLHQP